MGISKQAAVNMNVIDNVLGNDGIIQTNGKVVTENVTIDTNTNAMSIGPIEIDDNVTITVNGNFTVVQMSGTLQVGNIIGPTTGADANKVIIPSGQTLDASGATLVPSVGQMVKTETYTLSSSGTQSVGSTSYVELTSWGTPTFTKTKSTNLLYCNLHYYNYFSADPTYWWLRATVNGSNVTSNNDSTLWGDGLIDTHNSRQYTFREGAHQTRHTHFWDNQDTSSAVFRFWTKGHTTSANVWWNDGHVTLVIQEIAQ